MGQGFISKHILQDIADYIRVRRGLADKIAPVDMRAELDKIPTYEDAQKDTYNWFWDIYQQNGNRGDYRNAFYGAGWTLENFKPKYDMNPTDSRQMFSYFLLSTTAASLTDVLNDLGVVLDTSNCVNHKSMFYGSRLTEAPNIDVRKSTDINGLFYGCAYLQKAELTVAEKTVPNYDSVFYSCRELVTLIIHGKFDKSLDLSLCTKLSKASIDNVLDSLSSVSNSETITFSKTAADKAYSATEWETLKSAHTNWVFKFV